MVGERLLERRERRRIKQIGDADQLRRVPFGRQQVRPARLRIDPDRALI
jgi:hypothetical protein